MVYCIQADLRFSTTARRNQALTDIQSQISAQPTWGETIVVAATSEGQPAVLVESRFTAQPAQQAIVNRIETFLTGVRTPLVGSWYALHPCPHDEAFTPCTIASRRSW